MNQLRTIPNNRPRVTVTTPGVGVTGLLTVAFIVLKLTHVIAWSWWWVLAPLWVGPAISILVVLVVLAVVMGRRP